MNELKIGGVYQHRKGGLYIVLAVAQSTDDPSARLVVYRDEEMNTWARRESEFLDGRFELLDVEALRKDAERYRTLRRYDSGYRGDEAFPKTAEAYDSWVDALPEGDAS